MPPHWSERVQIPVGFGGFHVALLGDAPFGWPPFVLVYDCGALTEQLACEWAVRIGRRLAELPNACNLAVLSHTDFDHVCGIESLAKSVHIDTLMLPLLSLHFREAQMAAHFEKRPRWYRRFLQDPIRWAGEVGITNVIFVDQTSAEGPPPERVEPRPPEDATRPDQGRRIALLPGRTARQMPGEAATVMSSGDALTVQTMDPAVGWFLIPIVAPPKVSTGLETSLATELTGLGSTNIYAGLSMRKKGSLRNRLAQIYRRHWSNTNRSSVMLLVVPFDGDGGWLCTGDADLTSVEVQARLRQHVSLFRRVNAVHVPHHGSPHNCDANAVAFLRALTGNRPLRWVVSSGKNQWNYPSKAVEAACGTLHGPRQTSSDWSDIVCF